MKFFRILLFIFLLSFFTYEKCKQENKNNKIIITLRGCPDRAGAAQKKEYYSIYLTSKNDAVEPPPRQPYLIVLCLDKSSADSMGDSILSTVRKAAKLAV